MKHNKKRKENKMETTKNLASKGLYIGTGAGIILFVLFGMLPGSLIGGAIGLQISGMLLGSPVESALLPRAIVAISMVAGILASAFAFVVGTSVLGWAGGVVVDTVKGKRVPAEAHAESAD
jgi:hypothetical protein